MDEMKAITAFLTTAAVVPGAIPIATVSSGPGILVALGLGTTTTVALPVAGVVAAVGLVGYGLHKIQAARGN